VRRRRASACTSEVLRLPASPSCDSAVQTVEKGVPMSTDCISSIWQTLLVCVCGCVAMLACSECLHVRMRGCGVRYYSNPRIDPNFTHARKNKHTSTREKTRTHTFRTRSLSHIQKHTHTHTHTCKQTHTNIFLKHTCKYRRRIPHQKSCK